MDYCWVVGLLLGALINILMSNFNIKQFFKHISKVHCVRFGLIYDFFCVGKRLIYILHINISIEVYTHSTKKKFFGFLTLITVLRI